jgi:hypothetical protein
MKHLVKYKKELLVYLGQYYQYTTEFTLEMLPVRIQKNIDSLSSFIKQLEKDGYIEIQKSPFILKIKKDIPNYEYIETNNNYK